MGQVDQTEGGCAKSTLDQLRRNNLVASIWGHLLNMPKYLYMQFLQQKKEKGINWTCYMGQRLCRSPVKCNVTLPSANASSLCALIPSSLYPSTPAQAFLNKATSLQREMNHCIHDKALENYCCLQKPSPTVGFKNTLQLEHKYIYNEEWWKIVLTSLCVKVFLIHPVY